MFVCVLLQACMHSGKMSLMDRPYWHRIAMNSASSFDLIYGILDCFNEL